MADWTMDDLGPTRFVYDLGGSLEPEQVEIGKAIASFVPGGVRHGTAIKSGKGIGKTYCLGWMALWKLVNFRDSLVVLTAPKEDQIWDHLWVEIERIIRGSVFLTEVLDYTATRIAPKGAAEAWQMVGRVAKQKESIQGFHADHMLFVVDEATGVEDTIIETLIEGMTAPDNQIIMAANPWTTRGAFYDAFHRDKKFWNTLTFDASKSRRVSSASIQRNLRRGPDDPVAQVVVFGNFPRRSADSLFSLSQFYEARMRPAMMSDGDKVNIGVDVARYGEDSCAMAVRRARHIFHLDRWGMSSTTETAGRVIEYCSHFERGEIESIKVDVIGVGAGVVDTLLEAQEGPDCNLDPEIEVLGINVSRRSSAPKRYRTLRDELWISFSEIMNTVSVNPDIEEYLCDLMSSDATPAKRIFLKNGVMRVNSKEEMKKVTDGGNSPDLMDAILLCFHEQASGVIGEIDEQGRFHEV